MQSMKLKILCILFLGFWTTYSNAAKIWSGESLIRAVQGESVTMNWIVNLTENDADLKWKEVLITQIDDKGTITDVVTFFKLGKNVHSSYQSRTSDFTSNITQTGSVVTVAFTMANLIRTTDRKQYRPIMSFNSGFSFNPRITFLDIQVKPESTSIAITPNKSVFCNGSQVQINCTSVANPPAVYSLYRNNTLVQNGSSSGYFIVTLNKVGNYSYTCVPSNEAGVGQNKSLYLMVKEPPKISNCESDKTTTVVEGERFTFPCKISGSEPLTITWTDGTRVWNTKSLTFDPVNQTDQGTYNLTVSNGEECTKAERKNMKLDVYFIPESTSIIIMPNKRAFCNGSQVQINCTSHANPPAVYSLYRNDTLLQSGSSSGYFNVTLNKVGNYRYTCVPSNAAGVGQNKSSYLMVKEPPNITNCKSGTAINATEGGKFTFLCKISGSEPLNITWTDGTRVWNTKSLTFDPVNRRDNGTYSLTVGNGEECPEAERKNMTVDVYYPTDKVDCDNKTVIKGGNVELVCSPNGNPAPNMIWKRNGGIRGSSNKILLQNVSKTNDGIYTFIANNTLGVKSADVFLTVQFSPTCTITVNPTEVIKPNGMNVSCIPTYGEPRQLNATLSHPLGKYKGLVLNVPMTNQSNTGWYNCTVDNGIGTPGMCSIYVSVMYAPEMSKPPLVLPSTICLNQTTNVSCQAQANPNVTKYTFYDGSRYLGFSVDGTFQANGSEAGNNRNLSCIAVNVLGKVLRSAALNVLEPPNIDACKINGILKKNGTVREGDNVSLTCEVSGSQPLSVSYRRNDKIIGDDKTHIFKSINRSDSGSYTIAVNNGKECSTAEETYHLTVNYFSCPENFTKSRELVQEAKSRQYEFVGVGRPRPNISCSIPEVFAKNDAIYVDKTVSRNFSCIINNTAGSCRANFGIWKQSAKEIKKQGSLMLIREWNDDLSNNSTAAFVKLRKQVHEALMGFYTESDIEYLKDILDIYFVKGSVWVNFELILIANVTDAFKPIREALEKNDGKVGELRFNKTSVREFSTKDETTTTGTESPIPLTLIIGLAIGAFLLILLIILCVYYYRKKCINKDKPLIENGNEIPLNAANGRDNLGLASSSSVYVEKGPSPLDPANDSVRDNKSSQSAPSGDVYAQVNKPQKNAKDVDSMYAAVNKSKKPKKNPEPFYADLGDFNKSGEQPKGSHGGIVLQPLPEGEKPKMPEKYEETHYASIDFKKKPPVDKQGGDESDKLSNTHEESNSIGTTAKTESTGTTAQTGPTGTTGQTGSTGTTGQTGSTGTTGQTGSTSATEQTGSTSAKTDSGNPEEQKNVVGEEKNKVAMPGDNQATQPSAKEDSADSLVSRSRNNTTLTTVSL